MVRAHTKGQSQGDAEDIIGMETVFVQDRVQVACLGNCSIESDFFRVDSRSGLRSVISSVTNEV